MFGVSYIIPAFNEEENIYECITAIKNDLLMYPTLPHEIIVVDNCSTDSTAAIARCCGATVIREEQQGIVYARNAGAKAAKYSLLANIDADNRIPSGWTSIGLRIMANANVMACSGPLFFENLRTEVQFATRLFYYLARFFHLFWPTLQGGNFIIRKDAWEEMGGYDTNYKFYGEDTRIAQMVSRFGSVRLVPELWTRASDRRLINQGIIKTTWLYTVNYFGVYFGKQPPEEYENYR